jgi:molybdenum cofactor guanylyltransferase
MILKTQDKDPDRGPLEGLAAGFRSLPADTEAVYATSCDVPLMVPDFVSLLFDQLGTAEIAVPWDGQFHHPLSAVYRPRVLAVIEQLLASDQLRPRFLFDRLPTAEVPVDRLRTVDPQLQTLMNLNHPEDYAAALIQAGFPPGA